MIVEVREKLASVVKVCLCILSLDSMELCMFNVSLCLSVKFKSFMSNYMPFVPAPIFMPNFQ